MVVSSREVSSSTLGKGGGGGGGGGGTDEEAGNGILGPIDDLYIGGFPGGGAPVGFNVG